MPQLPRIMYVGQLWAGSSARRRVSIFQTNLGAEVHHVDTSLAWKSAGKLQRLTAKYLRSGPIVSEIENAIRSATNHLREGDVAFFDKPTEIRPALLDELNKRGIRSISYMPDNPFGPRRDGIWRLFNASLPLYDLHIVPRAQSVIDFKMRGAKKVLLHRFSYDPQVHFEGQDGTAAFRGYSYIGAAYEHRPAFLLELSKRLVGTGAHLSVNGTSFSRLKVRHIGRQLNAGPNLWDGDYRRAIWASKACLAFITRLNGDDQSHKAIEIAACGRVPILEPLGVHPEIFQDGANAIFFSSAEECADKMRYYWSRDEKLTRMGHLAAERVRALGLSEVVLAERALSTILARS